MGDVIDFGKWKRERIREEKARPRYPSVRRTALEPIGAISMEILRRLREEAARRG